jgi:hypothetical protein
MATDLPFPRPLVHSPQTHCNLLPIYHFQWHWHYNTLHTFLMSRALVQKNSGSKGPNYLCSQFTYMDRRMIPGSGHHRVLLRTMLSNHSACQLLYRQC